jgi:hypothetical protein
MKAKILILFVIAIITNSCNKGEFTTKPQLFFKSVNSTVIYPNQVLSFDIQFTSAKGNLQDSIWFQKVTKNCPYSNFTMGYPIPSFPASRNLKGDFNISLGYGYNLNCPAMPGPACSSNDTCVFRFWAKDLSGNISDTISSPVIVVVQ